MSNTRPGGHPAEDLDHDGNGVAFGAAKRQQRTLGYPRRIGDGFAIPIDGNPFRQGIAQLGGLGDLGPGASRGRKVYDDACAVAERRRKGHGIGPKHRPSATVRGHFWERVAHGHADHAVLARKLSVVARRAQEVAVAYQRGGDTGRPRTLDRGVHRQPAHVMSHAVVSIDGRQSRGLRLDDRQARALEKAPLQPFRQNGQSPNPLVGAADGVGPYQHLGHGGGLFGVGSAGDEPLASEAC